MFRIAVALIISALAGPAAAAALEERPELAAPFQAAGMPGTFVLYDLAADRVIVTDRDRAARRYYPASTFKIPNSLIALETGMVRDQHEVVPYGGKPQPVKAWERDMSIAEAITMSNVPVYQEIARRIGLPRMQAAVSQLGYGNRDIGAVVDRFWLDGPLEISALEQVAFLARLAQQALPLSARSQAIVREILRLERAGATTLYGKTGWTTAVTPNVGWWVGWVEREGRIAAFALNLDMARVEDAPKRLVIGKTLLARLGLL